MTPSELINELSRPDAWPEPPAAPVELVQTHISLLFFADDRVCKIKKPVDLGFLDYSTIEKRRFFCEEEVRLNRRLAPDVYRGVVPITREPDGSLAVDGDGTTVEYAVDMRRLPHDRLLSTLLTRDALPDDAIAHLARTLARFHERCEIDTTAHETEEPLRAEIHANLDALDPDAADTPVLSPTLHRRLTAALDAWLRDQAELLRRRAANGRVREGHGDLHAGNICLEEQGIVIYDCIEFSRDFRCRDVACELAFLAMDLDRRGHRDHGADLLREYARLAEDPDLLRLITGFKTHLALVRAKVEALRASEQEVDEREREQSRIDARRYAHLAAGYTIEPTLILTCGLPGTGKSVAASDIARPFNATILRSDVVRKELAGLAPETDAGAAPDAGIYTSEHTKRTYADLSRRARAHLERGDHVIVDATFLTRDQRAPFFECARDLDSTCILVEITCPEDEVRRRLRERRRDATEVSDAGWTTYVQARRRREPPDELNQSRRLVLRSPFEPDAGAEAVLEHLARHGADDALQSVSHAASSR